MRLFDRPETDPNRSEAESAAARAVDKAVAELEKKGVNVDAWTRELFSDVDFFQALPADIREHEDQLSEYVANGGRFHAILNEERMKHHGGDTSGLLGPDVEAPSVEHQDGRVRHAESGAKINVAHLRTMGIDPSKLLFFRVTQPSETPKPEYYWTSDLFETKRGLNAEIPAEQRRMSVILVADLETLDARGGLIQDINDDHGLPVRQLGPEPFDQAEALATIHPHNP